ncbi:AAA family ATPase [Salinirubellus salinus]|uniref:AAA family ATPase n=1 Tax=Salinirubellus salinus TaxID=1364945 RepID=A0A9E7R005_9EURY|nr:AAA family ATPase [Salinirubellus salinus]UWM52794.1 AAA family ATPase [Salinirubellus salinus]
MQRLVAVAGLPGVGKTTVSGAVAERLGATRLRSDVLRKELFSDPTYAASETEAVYRTLRDRAAERLAAGESVVLDATFREQPRRRRVAAVADDHGAAFRFVHVECADSVVRERIAAREGDASDADVAVYEQLKGEFEPVERDNVRVDNSGTITETRRQVDRAFPVSASDPATQDSVSR